MLKKTRRENGRSWGGREGIKNENSKAKEGKMEMRMKKRRNGVWVRSQVSQNKALGDCTSKEGAVFPGPCCCHYFVTASEMLEAHR